MTDQDIQVCIYLLQNSVNSENSELYLQFVATILAQYPVDTLWTLDETKKFLQTLQTEK